MPVPPALLRRFYVEGSLRNRRDGFELRLSNRLAPGTLRSWADELHDGGHRFLVTRDLESARAYLDAGRA